jgi:rhodanese-related sulfurtransferase
LPTPISRTDLLAELGGPEPPILVEALGAAYYDDAHLPGAVNIPPGQVDRLAPVLIPDRRSRIVVYCGGGFDSSLIAGRRLLQLGYADVRIYEGGKEDWVENGLPVDRSGNGAREL